ncbi:MAG: hypothetical protein DMF83_05025 [Acidobacteria bacterium]|nr:MAG: hypothetical protein DMF83_05025 [Acidobacteriota bacterium]
MAGRTPEEDPGLAEDRVGPAEPSVITVLALAAVLFVMLIANGRPSLAAPPRLPAVLRAALPVDDTAAALAGKVLAALFASLGGALLFKTLARRWPEDLAVTTAAALVLGTPVAAASQALWPQPVAVFLLCVALLFICRAEYDPVWAGRAGLPLGVAVAVNPIDAALVGVLALAIALRWPRRALSLLVLATAAVVVGLVARGMGFSSAPQGALAARFGFTEPVGPGALALVVSPGKGLLVFAPVVLVAVAGAAFAFRYGERWLAGSLFLAVMAHVLLAGCAREWPAGDAWGPRVLADAMPLLMLFLPEGLSRAGGLGWILVGISVVVQALGAFAYDDRWVRLEQNPAAPAHAELWDAAHSPVALYARRRVVILAAPGFVEGRVVVRTHPMVLFGPEGSRIAFGGEDPRVNGADATMRDVHLVGGARIEGDRLHLGGKEDGLFVRVTEEARRRPLELRVAGRGEGGILVQEGGFWNPVPRSRSYPATGSFLARHRYSYAESGGPDLRVVATGSGGVEIEWVALVAPGDPVNPIRTP